MSVGLQFALPIPPAVLSRLQHRQPFTPVYNLDRYGFGPRLARDLGLARRPRTDCEWIHGWSWWDDEFSAVDFMAAPDPRHAPDIVVATPRQRDALRAEGFERVAVGGVPQIYVPSSQLARVPGTLLAIPPHSSEAFANSPFQAEFLDAVADCRRDFAGVWVSVYAIDASDELFGEIRRRGLHPLAGANPADLRSMDRIRAIFDVFDAVVTNVMGSHVAYALAGGARVGVLNEIYHDPFTPERVAGRGRPELRRRFHRCAFDFVHPRVPDVFVSGLDTGLRDPAQGRELLGEHHRLSGDNLRTALGWDAAGRLRLARRVLWRKTKALWDQS